MSTWQGLPSPPEIDPTIGNSVTILQACVTMYQNLWQQEFVVDRFLNEQINWLLTTDSTANFTPSSGVQQQVPSWYAINQIATQSTSLVLQFQSEIYNLFTTANTTAVISNGQGGSATVPSYSALSTTANSALSTANAANTTATNANAAATTAQQTANTAQQTATIALGNTNPTTYATLAALQSAASGTPTNTIGVVTSDPTISNNTVYQLQAGVWVPIYDRLKVALGNATGFVASWGGATVRTYADKVGMLTNPEDAGAIGNGVYDCGHAFSVAGANGRVLTLMPNSVYYIATSTTVGDIIPNGSTIQVKPGVTLTFASIIGDPAAPVFVADNTGSMGNVVTTNNYYSAGWFRGTDASAKWKFCTQSFTQASRKTVYWPVPATTDPAAATGVDGVTRWNLTAPIFFDVAHSNTTVICDGTFMVSTGATLLNGGAFQFGANLPNAPTQVNFTQGLYVDCNSIAGYGIQVFAGSGINFSDALQIYNPIGSGFLFSNANGASSQIVVDTLNCTGFGTYGVEVNLVGQGSLAGTSPALQSTRIKTLSTQGGKTGCAGLVNVKGNVNGFYIDDVIESIVVGRSDWTGSMINVTNTTLGTTTGIGVKLGTIRSLNSVRPILTTADSSSLAQTKIIVFVDHVQQSATTGIPVQLSYTMNSRIGMVDFGLPTPSQATLISCTPDCEEITIEGTHWSAVNSVAPNTKFDGRLGVHGTLADSTSVAVNIPANMRSQKFDLMVVGVDKTYATGWVSISGTGSVQGITIPGYVAPPTAGTFSNGVTLFTAGPLTGTTGTAGNFTISADGDSFYVENRLGGSQTFALLYT